MLKAIARTAMNVVDSQVNPLKVGDTVRPSIDHRYSLDSLGIVTAIGDSITIDWQKGAIARLVAENHPEYRTMSRGKVLFVMRKGDLGFEEKTAPRSWLCELDALLNPLQVGDFVRVLGRRGVLAVVQEISGLNVSVRWDDERSSRSSFKVQRNEVVFANRRSALEEALNALGEVKESRSRLESASVDTRASVADLLQRFAAGKVDRDKFGTEVERMLAKMQQLEADHTARSRKLDGLAGELGIPVPKEKTAVKARCRVRVSWKGVDRVETVTTDVIKIGSHRRSTVTLPAGPEIGYAIDVYPNELELLTLFDAPYPQPRLNGVLIERRATMKVGDKVDFEGTTLVVESVEALP